MTAKIFHNPRCSKSRATLELLIARGIEPEVVEYLQTPPTASELSAILDMLGMSPRELMRTGQDEYTAQGLDSEALDREALIAAMVAHPILIERPIVVANGQARIGRPPESVLEII